MSQFYSNPKREHDVHALPNCEVFYQHGVRNTDGTRSTDPNFEHIEPGWYYWYCFPGCMPDSGPDGPYATEEEAIAACRDDAMPDDYETCGTCGYDHDYEYESAEKAHKEEEP